MNSRKDLISSLSTDLTRVKPAMNVDLIALLWLFCSAVYVVALTHLFGPIRSNALSQLATEPRFLAETLCGIVALVITTLVAFRAAVPGALSVRFARAGLLLMAVWLSCYLFGLVSPALEPSMAGKRPHCVWETFVYAIPPVIFAFGITRRLYPLQPVQTAMIFGLVSGMIPALYMQIACMYMPAHILQFHILPGMMVAVIGASLAWFGRHPRDSR